MPVFADVMIDHPGEDRSHPFYPALAGSPRWPARGSVPQPLSNEPYGLLDVGANVLGFRAPGNLFQRRDEPHVAPFEQLHEGRDVRRMRMEVVPLVGVLLGEPDKVERVLSNLFGVRRGLPLCVPALPRWVAGAVNVHRPDWDGVPARPVVRGICTIGMERVRDVQIADLAMARNVVVEVRTAPLSLE